MRFTHHRGFTPHHFFRVATSVTVKRVRGLVFGVHGDTAVYGKSGKGFTLIELLVVIAIIGVLASVTMVMLSEAREKGRNSARNSTVEQYMKALELMRTNEGSYVGDSAGFQCLGDYSDDTCWTGSITENAALQAALSPHIALPPGDFVGNAEGFVYRPCPATGGGCSASHQNEVYEIRWFLEGTDRECAGGQDPAQTNNAGRTYCRYLHF